MTIAIVFNEFPILTTQRLTLRQMQQSDLDAIFALYSTDDVTGFIDIESISTKDEAQELLDFFINFYNDKKLIRWAITLTGDDTLIGTIGFNYFDGDAQWSEIGYDLHPDHWRKGIMSEAVRAIMAYGFDTLQLHRIEANVTVGNDASTKLLDKLGFTYEGTLRDRMYIRGGWHSLMYYGMLQSEYTENHKGSQ